MCSSADKRSCDGTLGWETVEAGDHVQHQTICNISADVGNGRQHFQHLKYTNEDVGDFAV